MLVEAFNILGIISMPAGVFRPYAGVKTSVIIFSKAKPQKKIWFYELNNDGFSLDEKRNPISENDIPDLLKKWEDKPESENSWRVDIEEIKNNDYNLTAGRYKKHKTEEVQYEDPKVLIDKTIKLEEKISEGLKELRKRLE